MKSTLAILAILSLFYYVNGSYPFMSSSKEYDQLLYQMIDMIQKADGIQHNPNTNPIVRVRL